MGQFAEARFGQCIDGLYGVLADPASFSSVLGSVAELFGATGASFIRTGPTGNILTMDDHGRDPSLVRRFVDYYADIDPTKAVVVSSRPGIWFHDDRVLDPRHTAEPEYVNDFAIEAGLRWLRGGKVEESTFGAAFFSVHRPADAKEFDHSALELLEALRPHLARVARLLSDSHIKEARHVMPTALTDALSTGLCVLDARLRVVYANKAAFGILSEAAPIRLGGNVLEGATSSTHSQLRRAVQLATTTPRQARSFSPNPDDLLLRRLQVRVLPLAEPSSLARSAGGPFALVFVARGTNPVQPDGLCQLFGLTRSEADLVRLLSQGLSPAMCADRRQVSLSTVRTQLKCVYAKTGVNSLPQLMSLVLAMPGLLQGEG